MYCCLRLCSALSILQTFCKYCRRSADYLQQKTSWQWAYCECWFSPLGSWCIVTGIHKPLVKDWRHAGERNITRRGAEVGEDHKASFTVPIKTDGVSGTTMPFHRVKVREVGCGKGVNLQGILSGNSWSCRAGRLVSVRRARAFRSKMSFPSLAILLMSACHW